MPNVVNRSRKRRYIECICYVLLLSLFIPIKLKNLDEDEVEFQKYITKFNKTYNATEYSRRLQAFQHSLQNIKTLNLNQSNTPIQYGFTKFTDLYPEEFLQTNLLVPDISTQLKRLLISDNFNYIATDESDIERIKQLVSKNIPQKLDWREKNVVTPVKSQQSCSACWAFSAVGMIESINAIKNATLVPLSVQNVIDCSPFDGCNGGNVCSLVQWMKTNKFKLHTESEYPLTLRNGKCKNVSSEGVQIKNYVCKDFVGSEEGILYSLALNGPVAVAINALSWQNYVGGTIQFHCDGNPSKLNHAVEIVGYDLTKDVPYYIVKNSWGEDFGDNGYLYIAVGKNMCGLAYEVTVAVV